MSNRERSSGAPSAFEGETPAYTHEELAGTDLSIDVEGGQSMDTDTIFKSSGRLSVTGGFCAAVEWQQDESMHLKPRKRGA